MVDEAIVGTVRRYLAALRDKGFDIRFGVVFGSYVTGRADEWSDIDLLVISPRFDPPRNREDIHQLWYTTTDVDSRIEPIACGQRQWEEDDVSTIVEIARREGQRINPPDAA